MDCNHAFCASLWTGESSTYRPAALPRRRSFPRSTEMHGAGVFFLLRQLLAMPDRSAVTQPDGSITAVDTSEIDNTKADLLAQAVGQIVDGAEHEATNTLRELASDLDGQGLLSECSEDLAHARERIDELEGAIGRKDAEIDTLRKRKRSLEAKVERLREGMIEIMDYIEGCEDEPMEGDVDPQALWQIANNALDAAEDDDA